jgi:hypothetical protein
VDLILVQTTILLGEWWSSLSERGGVAAAGNFPIPCCKDRVVRHVLLASRGRHIGAAVASLGIKNVNYGMSVSIFPRDRWRRDVGHLPLHNSMWFWAGMMLFQSHSILSNCPVCAGSIISPLFPESKVTTVHHYAHAEENHMPGVMGNSSKSISSSAKFRESILNI